MKRSWIFLLPVLCFSCANPVAPEGGAKDTRPPVLDTLRSEANRQTGFRKRSFFLFFDEWVQLKDAANQVTISPPLKGFPEFKTVRKGIEVVFPKEDTLRENTTYTLNFGNSIQDVTESNALENFRFLFSTGPFLDSFLLRGEVANAEDGKSLPSCSILLHAPGSDSAVVLQKPLYAAKSRQDGKFTLENLHEGKYRVFALLERNNNLLYDAGDEAFAWLDSLVSVPDVQDILEGLETSIRQTGLAVMKVQEPYAGLLKVQTNRSLLFPFTGLEGKGQVRLSQDRDTLFLWCSGFQDSSRIWIGNGDISLDTLTYVPKTGLKPFALSWPQSIPVAQKFPVGEPYRMKFRFPVRVLDTTAIRLYRMPDSTNALAPMVRQEDDFRISLGTAWARDAEYRLEVQPAAFQAWNGASNEKILLTLKPVESVETGKITMDLQVADSTDKLIVLLKDARNVNFRKRLSGSSRYLLEVPGLPAGDYQAEVIRDSNGDGEWTPGDFFLRRKPEAILRKSLETLRANWELNVLIEFKP